MKISPLALSMLAEYATRSLTTIQSIVGDAARPYPIAVVHMVKDRGGMEWELEVTLRPADLPRPTPLLEAP